jgi:hypothetical protein
MAGGRGKVNYIRFDEAYPLLKQARNDLQSAAFLLHPFIQMPEGWTAEKREKSYQHIYPSNEEIDEFGKPISWETVREKCDFASLKEVGLALSSPSLNKFYRREDLEERTFSAFSLDFYWPMEDQTSIYLCEGILKTFASTGSSTFLFSEPTGDSSGQLTIAACTPFEVPEIAPAEVLFTDEKGHSIFMSQYDRYTTLFLTNEEKIQEVIERHGWEAVICGPETKLNWFLE